MRNGTRVKKATCKIPIAWQYVVLILSFVVIGESTSSAQQAVTATPASNSAVRVFGLTMPVREAMLGAARPTLISHIAVEEGDSIEKGQILFVLDDRVQRAQTEKAKTVAESTLAIELAKTKWERARRDWDRLEKLYGGDSASSKELSDALAARDINKIEYDLANFRHTVDSWIYQREQHALAEYLVSAPFSGYVAEVFKEEGEPVEQGEGVVRVAQLDPLVVSFACPLTLATQIHAGNILSVNPVSSGWKTRAGEVVLVNRVADGASQTFNVKLAIPNRDDRWIAGLKVYVDFQQGVSERDHLSSRVIEAQQTNQQHKSSPTDSKDESKGYRE